MGAGGAVWEGVAMTGLGEDVGLFLQSLGDPMSPGL